MKKPAKLEDHEVAEDRPYYKDNVIELKECESYEEANRYLGDDKREKWILIKIYMNTVQHYANTADGVKTFQKFIKIYVLGRVR